MTYVWNRDFTQATITWYDRKIGVLFVPKFSKVLGKKQAVYLFNEAGEYRRFIDEEAARAYVLKCVESFADRQRKAS